MAESDKRTALALPTPPESGLRLVGPNPGLAAVDAVAEPEIMTAEETARFLRLTVATVRVYVKEGKIPGARFVGKEIRVHRPTLVASFADAPDRRPWRRGR